MVTEFSGQNLKETATAIFNAGIRAVDPIRCVETYLHLSGNRLQVGKNDYHLEQIENIFVIGTGKASAAMAMAVERILGNRIHRGLVLTKYGHAAPLKKIQVMEAGHPVPDKMGVIGTEKMLALVSQAGPADLILCLVSGGGSALCPLPVEGISLADKQETTKLLLASGATIHEMNTIRKHLSQIKGGQLCLKAGGANIAALILSDVIGDDPDIIASGLTAPDPTTFSHCLNILERYDLTKSIPDAVGHHLTKGSESGAGETPKPDNPLFLNVKNCIIGSISQALNACEKKAHELGLTPLVLSSMIQGEASEVGKILCGIAKEIKLSGRPLPPPACLLSGGETTVTLRGDGLGGRNMEMALSCAIELENTDGILFLSAGTDGNDGPTDAAGAFADGSSIARGAALGISAVTYLRNNDSYRFFHQTGDLLRTGPTRTNVMDLQIILATMDTSDIRPLMSE